MSFILLRTACAADLSILCVVFLHMDDSVELIDFLRCGHLTVVNELPFGGSGGGREGGRKKWRMPTRHGFAFLGQIRDPPVILD